MNRFFILIYSIALVGCTIESNPRDATAYRFPDLPGFVTDFLPSSLAADSDRIGAPLCEGCQDLGSALRDLFHDELQLETRVSDWSAKMNSINASIENHVVDCLDSPATELTDPLSETFSVNSKAQCYKHYPNPEFERDRYFEQLSFGSQESTHYLVNRIGNRNDFLTTWWIKLSTTSATITVASNQGATGAGARFAKILLVNDGTAKIHLVGANQFTSPSIFACSSRMVWDQQFLKAAGRFTITTDAESCSTTQETEHCLAIDTLTSVPMDQCSELVLPDEDAPVQDDLIQESWGDRVLIDYSRNIDRFSVSGREVY